MKRLLFFICTLLCANVIMAQEFWEGDLEYEVIGAGEVAVSSCSYSATSVNIPSTVTHTWNNGSVSTYSVTSIGDYAFYHFSSLTSVTIGNSVTSIGERAFGHCSGLTSVTIPNSVTSIDEGTFYNCSGLISVTIPNSVTSIGNGAFYNCINLTSIDIPNSVTSIVSGAFYNCSSLTSVDIPNSVSSIEHGAFQDCSSLTSVTIGNSVTSIGERAFYNCSSLTTLNYNAINCEDVINSYLLNCPITTINIGDSVQRIPEYFAYNLSSLTSVNIPNSVTEIGGGAFWGCSSLTSVTIPNSVTSIGGSAFYGCSSLTSIDIPNSVTSIGAGAFEDCSSLTSVTIPNSVTSIEWSAFSGCSSLTSVTIPENITYIDNNTFYNCSGLTSVTIPNSVTAIGSDAFSGCSSLTSITIPNSVTIIGYEAFMNCSSLTSVTIPNSVTIIGYSAFYGCSSLTTLNYNAINCPNFYYYDEDDYYYENYGYQFAYCPITTINIGDSVQRIPNYFAYNLDSLTSITIPNSVDTIGSSAFYNCSSLDSITCLADIPPALGNNVFNNTPSNKILYVNCGLINDYISSWTCFYPNNIQEITFDIDTYVNNEIEGSVAIERNNCSTATFTATANNCYQFVSWNDGNTENPRVVSLSSDTSFTAIFDSILFDTNINATINAGETYTENGFNVNEEGTYTQTLQTINGCDSIVTLTLNIIPVFNTELTVNICEGQVYNENGFNVSEAGVYTQNLTASNGFDSIVTLTLNVNPIFDTTINATINAGETYVEFGFNESEAGTYVQNLQTEFGCDSTITLVLSVNSSLLEADIEETEISLYPNPTDSKITFSQMIEKVEVIDLTGKTIFTFSNAKTINIESLPSGAYYLRLTNNDKAIMRKVIKE